MTKHPLPATVILASVAMVGGCQTASQPQVVATKSAQTSPPAFVEAACGGCHAVEPPFLSPNPQAPSFEAVANRPGVTKATVRAWLVNAHNYPEVMDFDLNRDHVDEVATYMIKLRRTDYVPPQ